MNPNPARQMTKASGIKGFTLLEMLIAIGIFGLIGVASHQLFTSVIAKKAAVDTHSLALQELQKSLYLMKRDLGQMVERAPRDGYGEPLPMLIADNNAIEFTRLGWDNPLGQNRSNLQRVKYSVVNSELQRHYWDVLDRAQDSQPVSQALLKNVGSWQIFYRKNDYTWQTDWVIENAATASNDNSSNNSAKNPNNESTDQKSQLPVGIKISLVHDLFGELEIVVDLPAATESEDNV